jgi:SAM-dependent methyltransferase
MPNFDPSEHDQNNASYVSAQSRMALLPNYYRWTYSSLLPYLRGNIIELAAGAGFGIGTYIDQASNVTAVDHDEELLADLRSRHPAVKTLSVDLLGDWSELAGEADAIVMMDVIEHFEDDLGFMKKVRSKLKPAGYALIKVPAQPSLYGDIDIASGHYRRYDEAMLKALGRDADFEICNIKDINVLGALAYRRKKGTKSNFSKTFSQNQLAAINRLLPVVAAVDKALPAKGLSLIAVLRRPD